MLNKKGPENQVPFYLVRLGEASVARKASLCASRTPAGYACGPPRRCTPAFGRLRRLVEQAYDFVGSSNLAVIMPNKKGPKNQVPFYLVRPERFELPTTWFVARYSIQLSYGRKSMT